MSENKYTRLAKDTAVFAAGNLLTKLIYFFMVPLYTSAMTTAQYGRAEMLNTLVDIVYPIATMYVVDAMYRFTIDDDADLQQTYGITMRITVWSIVLVTLGSVGVSLIRRDIDALLFGALYISFSIYKVVLQFARGLGRNVPFAIAGVLNALVRSIFSWPRGKSATAPGTLSPTAPCAGPCCATPSPAYPICCAGGW